MHFVKVCGITQRDDAVAAVENGATAIGFNFYKKSPRYIDPEQLDWAHELPENVWRVGVFVNENPAVIRRIVDQLKLDVIQLHGRLRAAEQDAGDLHQGAALE